LLKNDTEDKSNKNTYGAKRTRLREHLGLLVSRFGSRVELFYITDEPRELAIWLSWERISLKSKHCHVYRGSAAHQCIPQVRLGRT